MAELRRYTKAWYAAQKEILEKSTNGGGTLSDTPVEEIITTTVASYEAVNGNSEVQILDDRGTPKLFLSQCGLAIDAIDGIELYGHSNTGGGTTRVDFAAKVQAGEPMRFIAHGSGGQQFDVSQQIGSVIAIAHANLEIYYAGGEAEQVLIIRNGTPIVMAVEDLVP